MTEEIVPPEPGIPVDQFLHPAEAVAQRRGPHGDPLTEEQIRDIQDNKDIAALSYLWILSVVIYYHHRSSPFIRYHAKQGIWLFAFSIPVFLIPGIGHFLSFFTLAGMIIGFLNAAHGHYHEVPLIGRLASGTLTLGDIGKQAWKRGVKAAAVVQKGVLPKREESVEARESDETKDSGGKGLSWLPFGRIPFFGRREQEDVRVSAEPPLEDPTSPDGLRGAGDRGKAMISLSKLPTEESGATPSPQDGTSAQEASVAPPVSPS